MEESGRPRGAQVGGGGASYYNGKEERHVRGNGVQIPASWREREKKGKKNPPETISQATWSRDTIVSALTGAAPEFSYQWGIALRRETSNLFPAARGNTAARRLPGPGQLR